MSITCQWINHASYILKTPTYSLMVDPWHFGGAFNDSWQLLVESDTSFKWEEITHIWFSHEHPDHFAPQVLLAIPEETRKKITVLFQDTHDKRVVKFCKKIGFPVIELIEYQPYELDSSTSLLCGKCRPIDSWLLMTINRTKVLNVNDCVIEDQETCEAVFKRTGTVDILFSQFSYANWEGNPEDIEKRKNAAKNKLNAIKLQTETLKPSYLIPFASFVYFSHEENRYLNDHINTISKTHEFITNTLDTTPIILYPGDIWELATPHNNTQSLERYQADYDALSDKSFAQPLPPIEQTELIASSKQYVQEINTLNSPLAIWIFFYLLTSNSHITIQLLDTQDIYKFSLKKGLVPVDNNSPWDIQVSSHSLDYVFKHQWGIGSLLVNGRFRATEEGYRKLDTMFMLGLMNSTDRYFTMTHLIIKIIKKVLRVKTLATEEEWSLQRYWETLLKK